MTHKNRSRRKANERRRTEAEARQKPLPPAEQQDRSAQRRAAQVKRYPAPPLYRESYDRPVPEQPFCYWGWRDRKRNKAA